MRPFLAAAFLILAGCAGYAPQPIQITDKDQYAADLAMCQAAASAYKPSLGVSSVGYGILSGGASNAAGAALNPLVPLAGALGGGVSALSGGLDLMGRARDNVARHCLIEITHRDRSAIIADPD